MKRNLILLIIIYHGLLPMCSNAQYHPPPIIIGKQKLALHETANYQINHLPHAKGSWKIEPTDAGLFIDSNQQKATIQWLNKCSHPTLYWLCDSLSNEGLQTSIPIEIAPCSADVVLCDKLNALKPGNYHHQLQVQNGLWIKFQCDTSNQLITTLRFTAVYLNQLSGYEIAATKWWYHDSVIGIGSSVSYAFAAGNQTIYYELINAKGRIEKKQTELVIPSNQYLQLKGLPHTPVCEGATIDIQAQATDNRQLQFTKWLYNDEVFWFSHLYTVAKANQKNPITLLLVETQDQYGCVNTLANKIAVANNNIKVFLLPDRTLPDTNAIQQNDTVGKINAQVMGGTVPYTYYWLAKEDKYSSINKAIAITKTLYTTSQTQEYYILKVTDAYHCTSTSDAALNPIIYRKRYLQYAKWRK